MVEIRYRKWIFLNFFEIWLFKGENAKPLKDADVVVFHDALVKPRSDSHDFVDGIKNISLAPEEIFATFNSGFRNEVRRAEKEGVVVEQHCAVDFLRGVFPIYSEFCRRRSIPHMQYRRLRDLHQEGALKITSARLAETLLQVHFYVVDSTEALLLASFPGTIDPVVPERVTGWANRLLHWQDMIFFSRSGVSRYNLGGMGNSRAAVRSIVAFKSEMRPDLISYFNDVVPNSPLGALYLRVRAFYSTLLRS